MINESEKIICDNIFKYINGELGDCIDNEVFTKTSFQELGEFYFNKTKASVEGATDTLIKIVIRTISRNYNFKSDVDYYLACCNIVGIENLPKEICLAVQQEYNNIFVQMYNRITQKIAATVNTINTNLFALKNNIKAIENATPSHSLIRDLSTDEHTLSTYHRQCNELRTKKEMLLFSKQYLTSKLKEFCDIDNPQSIDLALRATTMSLSKHSTYDAAFSFSSYKDIAQITEDNLNRSYALFFKVKLYTAIDALHKNWHRTPLTKSDEERIEQLNSEKAKIPIIDELHIQKTTDSQLYLDTLKNFIAEQHILDNLSDQLNESICLRDRKSILFKSLELYKSAEFALFNHVIPIQIEGMFGDYLKDTTTFKRFTSMNIYINDVLKDKIQHLQDVKSEVYPEAIEYFMYYFNNIIRNKIAHGNYKSVFSNNTETEIFAHEILLDMSMLVHMLSRKSETDKMYRFISGYKQYYTRLIQSEEHPCFGALFNDMIGDKIISDYDFIGKNRPLQVAYWLINPYYEKIYESVGDKTDLLELRAEFLSKEFWEYTLNSLNDRIDNNYGYQNINMDFLSTVNGLFKCNVAPEVKVLLGKTNAALQKIKQMQKINI